MSGGRVHNVCAVRTRMCRARIRGFGNDCADVRLHEVRSYAGVVAEIERYTVELIMTAPLALPPMADLLLGAQEQR